MWEGLLQQTIQVWLVGVAVLCSLHLLSGRHSNHARCTKCGGGSCHSQSCRFGAQADKRVAWRCMRQPMALAVLHGARKIWGTQSGSLVLSLHVDIVICVWCVHIKKKSANLCRINASCFTNSQPATAACATRHPTIL